MGGTPRCHAEEISVELSILIPTVLVALLDIAVLWHLIIGWMMISRGIDIRPKHIYALQSVMGTLVVANVISGLYFGWL